MVKANSHEELEHDGYTLVLDNDGQVFERLEGNTNWWTIGSLHAWKTKEIGVPATILIKEEV